MRIQSVVAAGIRHVRVVRTGWTLDCWHWAVEKCKVSSGFKKWIPFSHLSQILYELEKKSSLVTRALSAKSCTRDTDSLHSCTRLRLVQEMACLYHECKILPRKHSYPNLIPIGMPAALSSTLQKMHSSQRVQWTLKHSASDHTIKDNVKVILEPVALDTLWIYFRNRSRGRVWLCRPTCVWRVVSKWNNRKQPYQAPGFLW